MVILASMSSSGCHTNCERAQTETTLGLAAWRAGDKVKARDHLEKATSLDQRNLLAYYYKLPIDSEEMNWDKVIEDCTRLISAGVETLAILSGRGEAYQMKGEYVLAQKDYQAIIHLFPDDYRGYFMSAGAYESGGELASALTAYETALQKIQPDPRILALLYYRKGALLVRSGQVQQGNQDIGKARALDPDLGKEGGKRMVP
jgi:tetratricopeptide (TPR) repeat protein